VIIQSTINNVLDLHYNRLIFDILIFKSCINLVNSWSNIKSNCLFMICLGISFIHFIC